MLAFERLGKTDSASFYYHVVIIDVKTVEEQRKLFYFLVEIPSGHLLRNSTEYFS